jgi:DNA polymerase-3 subunit epsilon
MSIYTAIDFETTGLSPKLDRAIEIGLVKFDSNFEIVDEYSTLLNPARDVGRTDIHGVTPSMLVTAPTFGGVASDVCKFINGSILIAHNKRFDLGFLENEFRRSGVKHSELDALCTLELLRSSYPRAPRRLALACEFLKIEFDATHEALDDARMAAHIAIHILKRFGYPAIPDPIQVAVPKDSSSSAPVLRSVATSKKQETYISRIVADLPDHGPLHGQEAIAASEYLNLLERTLEDRVLDYSEAVVLGELAQQLGLGAESVRILHSSFLYALCRAAKKDGFISDDERSDIEQVAEILEISNWEKMLDAGGLTGTQDFEGSGTILPNMTVCFTGTMQRSRADCEQLAKQKGLVVLSGVTKRLEILVVADPHTQSGKAKKAREDGTRIMAESVFFAELSLS